MRIVLDTNEYIFGLDREAEEVAPGRVLDAIRILIEESKDFRLLLPEIIRKEVQRNIPEDLEGDALIAAFAEFVKTDYLVSENRHIYRDLDIQEFTAVNAKEFLELLEKG